MLERTLSIITVISTINRKNSSSFLNQEKKPK